MQQVWLYTLYVLLCIPVCQCCRRKVRCALYPVRLYRSQFESFVSTLDSPTPSFCAYPQVYKVLEPVLLEKNKAEDKLKVRWWWGGGISCAWDKYAVQCLFGGRQKRLYG